MKSKLTDLNGNACFIRLSDIIVTQLIVTPSMVIGEKASQHTLLLLPYGAKLQVRETPEQIDDLETQINSRGQH